MPAGLQGEVLGGAAGVEGANVVRPSNFRATGGTAAATGSNAAAEPVRVQPHRDLTPPDTRPRPPSEPARHRC